MTIKTKIPTVARVLLGLPLVVFGLNGFLQFLPMPAMDGDAATFMGGLGAAGYFFPLLKATEIAAGLALLSGRFVPLALTVLAPIVLHIVAFHALVVGGGVALPLLMLALGSYLAWAYRSSFAGVLDPRARPTDASDDVAANVVAHA